MDRFNVRATIIIFGVILLTFSVGLIRAIELGAEMERIVALIGLITTVAGYLAPSPLQSNSSRRTSDFTTVETPSESTVTVTPE